MNQSPFVSPQRTIGAFNCPHCNAYAKQPLTSLLIFANGRTHGTGFEITLCQHCSKGHVWLEDTMIYPSIISIPLPNDDMPADVMVDYNEARGILSTSPRGASALLRLAIQKLCKELGESGKNINDDIASLVKKGLPLRIQQALDIVRVIGNESVHPGSIDMKDNVETATKLFSLINIIVDDRITREKEITALYDSLPEDKRNAIEARDKN